MNGKSYFKLPNNIFDLGLSYQELLVLTYLMSVTYSKDTVFIKQSTIAEKLGYKTTNTISKVLGRLEAKGFIKSKSHYRNNKRIVNSYKVNKEIKATDKNFFIVERNLFSSFSRIKKTSIAVYLFILRCSNKNSAFPSISKISATTKISQVSICSAIKELKSNGLINKINQRKKDTSFGNNMYQVLKTVQEVIETIVVPSVKRKMYIAKKIFKSAVSYVNQFYISRVNQTLNTLFYRCGKLKRNPFWLKFMSLKN